MTGLYIHFPFCIKKCHYCDFVSYPEMLSLGERYIDALILEMEAYRGTLIDTVYLGGGTPTALAPSLLVRVLSRVASSFSLAKDCEITVEANPGTCDKDTFSALASCGVNRISLGVQSFSDDELKMLGRIHTKEDAVRAVEAARIAGISNLSLDLMFSTPGQTRESLYDSLFRAVALEPEHMSCYSLILCEGTPMHEAYNRGEITLPDEDEDRDRYALLVEFLEKHGYERYEISNFAKEKKISRHNTKYWTRAPYIGLGAAAHSFYENRRFENPASLSDYFKQVEKGIKPIGETVTEVDAMGEFMFLGLRQTQAGVLRSEFQKCFGKSLDDVFGKTVKKLTDLNLLADDGERIRLTDRGIDVSNAVFCEFI